LPKLNVIPVNKLSRPFNGIVVIASFDNLKIGKTPLVSEKSASMSERAALQNRPSLELSP
jgi:hypothetical protein